jgi:hypothetical protein
MLYIIEEFCNFWCLNFYFILFYIISFFGAKHEENMFACLVNDPQGKGQENHA